ncbi:MAG: creatininase family protein [archaeon GB-1867-035]|nr:creatininase family protein [Candidatus Culexmicrobium profundum]
MPLGARTKKHGPHMPLNTDWIIAEYLANRVASEVPVILMPTIQYGYYPFFLEYPGSVSLKLNTFKEMVKDICISMSNYGIKKFYVLNTGVSTIYRLKMAAEELRGRGIEMRYTDILKALSSVEKEISEQEGGTHADEIEIFMMLYIKPEVVDMSKAVKDYHPMKGRGLTRNPEKKDAGAYSPSGIFGDATLASAEKGEIIVENLVKYIIDEVREFMSK